MNEDRPNFKLEIFEGPLDLLLSLISKNKIDIFDIPISLILDQYMEYLSMMEKMDMDIAGDFIAMAAELMLIKSRMLLPKPESEDEEDPRAALASALIEYKKAKEAAILLNDLFSEYSGRFVKESDEFPVKRDEMPTDMDSKLLGQAFAKLINRNKLYSTPPEKMFAPLIRGKTVPVEEKIDDILNILETKGKEKFTEIISLCKSRSELVASFMAILELAKCGRILLNECGDDFDLVLNKDYDGRTEESDA